VTALTARLQAGQAQVRGDVLLAALAFGLTLALLGGSHGATRGLDALGVVLAAMSSLPLVARRHSPLAVFVVTTAASATANGLGYAVGPPFAPTIALFFVAADERTRAHIVRTAGYVVGVFAAHIASTAVAHGGFPTTPSSSASSSGDWPGLRATRYVTGAGGGWSSRSGS